LVPLRGLNGVGIVKVVDKVVVLVLVGELVIVLVAVDVLVVVVARHSYRSMPSIVRRHP
jgi:hypothetical protein